MHRRPPRLLVPVLLLVLIAAAWYLARGTGLFRRAAEGRLSGSGTIQADEYIVASETAGRIVELNADEGDAVHAGQVLAKLDAALLAAQVEQARANVAAAQANLDKLRAGTRPEEIRQAQAALAQTTTRLENTQTALADAQALLETPQDLQTRIHWARAALDAAEHRALAANLTAQAASLERDYYQRTLASLEDGTVIEIQTSRGVITKSLNIRTEDLRNQLALTASKEWNAWVAQTAAFAARDSARTDLNNLLAQQTDPLVQKAQVEAARAQVDTTKAAVEVARAKLEVVQAGTRAESIAAAQAQVAQAEAARDSLQAQLGKMSLTAPGAGLVSQRFMHLGEMALPGAAVFHIANLDPVTLTIYIPENQIGRVPLGAAASVSVDSFPGRVFQGQVTFISPQAEFTPKNIATQDQRSTQVFAVKITIGNSDQALKPGMPADAVIKE